MSLHRYRYKSIAGWDLPFAHLHYYILVTDFTSYANKILCIHAQAKFITCNLLKSFYLILFLYHAIGKALRMCFHINDQPDLIFLWEIRPLYLPKFQLDVAHQNRKSRPVLDRFLFYWTKFYTHFSVRNWTYIIVWFVSNLLFPISTVFLCLPFIGFLSSMLGLRSSWISRRAWVECHLSFTKYFQFTMS